MKIKKRNLLLLAAIVWMIAGFNILRIGIETYAAYKSVINFITFRFLYFLFLLVHDLLQTDCKAHRPYSELSGRATVFS